VAQKCWGTVAVGSAGMGCGSRSSGLDGPVSEEATCLSSIYDRNHSGSKGNSLQLKAVSRLPLSQKKNPIRTVVILQVLHNQTDVGGACKLLASKEAYPAGERR